MNQECLSKWFTGLCCLIGQLGIDYSMPETDPYWWGVYLWTKRN